MSSFAHIQIEGSAAFVAATQKALALLQRTPSWELATHIRRIRELENEDPCSGGYLFGTEFNVANGSWTASPQYYASQIAHEGAHAKHGDSFGGDPTENERQAFTYQAQALRELGASRSEIAYCEAHARNPTHHEQWAKNPQSGRAGHVAQPVAQQEQDAPTRQMGSIERMAHAYHAKSRRGWFS